MFFFVENQSTFLSCSENCFFACLLAAVSFNLEAHDLFNAHCLLDSHGQCLAVVEVSADRAGDRLVVLERKIEVLALLALVVEERELALVVDVDELELGLGDDGAGHGVRGGAEQLVLLEVEDVLAGDGALGAAVLAVLEDVHVGDLARAPADADEVALLEVAGGAGERVGRTRVGALEVLEVFIVIVVAVVVVAGGIIEILLVAVRSHFVLFEKINI